MTVDEVKKRLKVFTDLATKLENKRERLREIELRMYTPRSSQITDTPKAPRKGTSIQDDLTPIKMELEEEIENLYNRRERERAKLTKSAEAMDYNDPREPTVIQMRYIDGQEWEVINQALFGKLEDFDDKQESYKRRTFQIHARALSDLAQYWTKHPRQAI